MTVHDHLTSIHCVFDKQFGTAKIEFVNVGLGKLTLANTETPDEFTNTKMSVIF